MIPVLHAITTDAVLRAPDFVPAATRVLRAAGPRGALHLRGGELPARELLRLAEALRPVAAACGAWLVVNDRLDVALAACVTGVQLTTRSLGVGEARRLAPALRVGASVHDAAAAARAAAEGADWLVAGHVHPTASHPGEPGRGIAFVRDVCATAYPVPVVAIGGVRPTDVPALRAAGATGVAVIRGVWGARDAERAVTDYLSAHDADPDG